MAVIGATPVEVPPYIIYGIGWRGLNISTFYNCIFLARCNPRLSPHGLVLLTDTHKKLHVMISTRRKQGVIASADEERSTEKAFARGYGQSELLVLLFYNCNLFSRQIYIILQ